MKKLKGNRGFSLVELIVVIAILGVMTTVGGYALTAISSANAKECARELEAALISTRTHSYSNDVQAVDSNGENAATGPRVAEVTFYKGADGIYMEKSFESEPKKIGGSRVSVAYLLSGGTDEDYVDICSPESNPKITFSFNRSSGAFRTMKVDGSSAGMCESIRITSGSKTYTITCYEHTGKTKLE
jgi:prepilin-type N-terminal cleavage/methylation domain-containing protein